MLSHVFVCFTVIFVGVVTAVNLWRPEPCCSPDVWEADVAQLGTGYKIFYRENQVVDLVNVTIIVYC